MVLEYLDQYFLERQLENDLIQLYTGIMHIHRGASNYANS